MTESNTQLLRQFYDALIRNDVHAMLEPCAPEVTFQVPGKSKLSGKHAHSAIGVEYTGKMQTLSDGTLKIELHDLMASDQHGLVLMTNTLTRGGTRYEYRTVHVWRIQKGRLIAGYEYPRDLYQFDVIWGS